MVELSCILGTCVDAFLRNQNSVAALGLAGAIVAVSAYFVARNRSMRARVRWSYPLMFGVMFLLTYFTFFMSCHAPQPMCVDHALMYSIPGAVIGSLLFGYLVLPRLYLAWMRASRSRMLSRLLPQPVPVYIADRGAPFAYSYGGLSRWIVVSQGLVDILTRQELAAVLLHEYRHIDRNASFYQASRWVYGKMPLLHAFLDARALEDEEEMDADCFAARCQGTRQHLESAKRKLGDYFGC